MNGNCDLESLAVALGDGNDAYRDGIVQVAQHVFDTLLHVQVEILNTSNIGLGIPPNDVWTAAIFYAGLWDGALLLECSEEQARSWSSSIMQIPEPTIEDVRDGLGELANVFAGNLKPLLTPGVSISLPTVVEGPDYQVHILKGCQTTRIVFTDQREPFRVTFAQKKSD